MAARRHVRKGALMKTSRKRNNLNGSVGGAPPTHPLQPGTLLAQALSGPSRLFDTPRPRRGPSRRGRGGTPAPPGRACGGSAAGPRHAPNEALQARGEGCSACPGALRSGTCEKKKKAKERRARPGRAPAAFAHPPRRSPLEIISSAPR